MIVYVCLEPAYACGHENAGSVPPHGASSMGALIFTYSVCGVSEKWSLDAQGTVLQWGNINISIPVPFPPHQSNPPQNSTPRWQLRSLCLSPGRVLVEFHCPQLPDRVHGHAVLEVRRSVGWAIGVR